MRFATERHGPAIERLHFVSFVPLAISQTGRCLTIVIRRRGTLTQPIFTYR